MRPNQIVLTSIDCPLVVANGDSFVAPSLLGCSGYALPPERALQNHH